MRFFKKAEWGKVPWLKVSKTESWRVVGERFTEKEEKERNHCTTVNLFSHSVISDSFATP